MTNATQEDLGTIGGEKDQRTVRLERRLDAIPAEVWASLTEPERIRHWLAPAEIDPREGGDVRIGFDETPGEGGVVTGTIRVCVDEKVIEYDWNETDGRKSIVRFELEPSESGTKLTLTHSLLDDESVPNYAAGWVANIEALKHAVRRIGRPTQEQRDAWMARYEELRPIYLEKLASL